MNLDNTNEIPEIPRTEVNTARENWSASVQRLYTDVSDLFQKESLLIRAEINEKVSDIKTVGVEMVAAGVVLFVGLLCTAASLIILLDLATKLWVAALIVTAAFLIVGGVLFASAKKKMAARSFVPTKSIDAISEFSQSLKEKVHEITKH